MKALIFDCDGVLVDTERDGHRVAFNRAFEAIGLPDRWSIELYGQLLKVSGGKERMKHYFDQEGWPEIPTDREGFIGMLHRLKTEYFLSIVESGELPLRPGVARLVDEAAERELILAVCSTSNERSVNLVVERLLGPKRRAHFAAVLAGDVVSRKKPDPEIYLLALRTLALDPADCLVVEDSRNGLLAARGAGIRCLITTNGYTADEDFSEASRMVPELGDPPHVRITIDDLYEICRKQAINEVSQ
jgi:HAD superfamily hydrolase (TIGR01509 family)